MIGSQTEERVRVTLLSGVLDTLHHAAYGALSVYYSALWMEMAKLFLGVLLCSGCAFSN